MQDKTDKTNKTSLFVLRMEWLTLVQIYAPKSGFFLYAPKKTETEKLSFFKKLRLKIEQKLKTEPKKLRSLEALCSGYSPKNSDYWRPSLVT